MKIVAYVHGYLPNHNAGAETMLHQILVGLSEYGHEVSVITKNAGADEYEGVKIYDDKSYAARDEMAKAEIVFTHLDYTRFAVQAAIKYRIPIVHLVHNDKQLAYNKINSASCDLVVANSDWIKDTVNGKLRTVVVYPPTDPKYYKVKTSRKAISLLNMNEAKGGKIFWQLARIFPDRQFIGVKGAYGEQIGYEKDLPNVTLYENDPDVKKIYKQSRIVLMPSSYESWGRVAIEASCSGIPVIAAPTPGLKESLAYAGIFVEHDDVAGYVEAIRMLDDKETYEKYSKLTEQRAQEVTDRFKEQLAILEREIRIIKV